MLSNEKTELPAVEQEALGERSISRGGALGVEG